MENGLTQTHYLFLEAQKLDLAVETAIKTQDMTSQLYTTGLSNSLELLYAQLNTLTSRIDAVQVKTNLLNSSVALIRSLGGGWHRKKLPADQDIQPMSVFEVSDFVNPKQIKGMEVGSTDNSKNIDLTKPVAEDKEQTKGKEK